MILHATKLLSENCRAKGFFKAVKLFEVFSCKLRRFNVMVIFTATTVRTGELYFTVLAQKKFLTQKKKIFVILIL